MHDAKVRRDALGALPATGAFLPVIIAGLVVAAMLATAAATIILCGGSFSYSLDDPYISLSLARQIANGHYGINSGEFSSPASSILYPFVLAPLSWIPFFQYVPLVLNGAAASASGYLLGWTAWRYGIFGERADMPRAVFLTVLLCLSMNIVGLAFTGLEHSLHLLTSLLVVLGLVRTVEYRAMPAWLPVAIVLAPLWRFEGMALALLALAVLLSLGHWRAGLAALGAIALLLGGFMLALHGLGLPALPASVLLKSATAKMVLGVEPSPLGSIYANVKDVFSHDQARPLLLLMGAMALHPLWRKLSASHERRCRLARPTEAMLIAVGFGSGLAQMLFGAFGWFSRYEIYAVGICLIAALLLWQGALAAWLPKAPLWQVVLACMAIAYVGRIYLLTTVYTPEAARGIYEQQYQMRRFVLDFYRRPVAVNDLGWVSFGNPNYVLDLIGLGSEAVRRARMSHEPAGWADRLLRQHGIGLVMMYEEQAGAMSAGWRRLAVLHTADPTFSTFSRDVAFYATTAAAAPGIEESLAKFAPAVKPWAELRLDPIN